jgi:hypothetical protein
MWQLVVVLTILTVVLVYVIRHYVKVFRADVPTCSGCSGSCGDPAKSSCDGSGPPSSNTG